MANESFKYRKLSIKPYHDVRGLKNVSEIISLICVTNNIKQGNHNLKAAHHVKKIETNIKIHMVPNIAEFILQIVYLRLK